MKYSCVTYRTPDNPYHKYVIVPEIFLSDILGWLKLSESARITSITDNNPKISDLLAPETWPSYGTCEGYILGVKLLGNR